LGRQAERHHGRLLRERWDADPRFPVLPWLRPVREPLPGRRQHAAGGRATVVDAGAEVRVEAARLGRLPGDVYRGAEGRVAGCVPEWRVRLQPPRAAAALADRRLVELRRLIPPAELRRVILPAT